MDQVVSLRISAVAVLVVLIAVAWKWVPAEAWDVDHLTAALAPYRRAWYALPMVMVAFVVLAVVPVLLLIAATGVAFGPVLGPIYALAGSLAGASIGFAIGRWLGARRVHRLGGERVQRLTRALSRNGTLAVYLVRKVPMPFLLANVIVGASAIAYRDFVIGTVLGMAPIIVALAGFGYHLTKLVQDPSPATVIAAALMVGVPLTLAWLINRQLRARTAE